MYLGDSEGLFFDSVGYGNWKKFWGLVRLMMRGCMDG